MRIPALSLLSQKSAMPSRRAAQQLSLSLSFSSRSDIYTRERPSLYMERTQSGDDELVRRAVTLESTITDSTA